ncbi:radical SAM protein [Sulfurimonas sp. C5]|uniref:radical SAM protein n=1 Tax=Sulfurimonas sp. C5 TaxID=3036947 RepID=UPI0024571839|nr:radical SAM protein [Sulfurimonas sp. C5]MDH4944930.1 radical SAM protein [Sulfurimonas sp. C5]
MQNTLSVNVTVSAEKNNIIFGPINSRRFGMSLGIDLSPATKQCNFDCLYCELAPAATVDKQTTVTPVQEIISELKKHLHDKIDVITLTANGEPTLYPHLDSLIDEINKIKGSTQTLILTNSAMLTNEKVYNSLLKLDQVKLSLDAVTPAIFKKIDRPHHDINVEDIVSKVQQFSKDYKGKLFIEILFVLGLNDTKEEVEKLNDVLLSVNTARIDLGTIDRPPAYPVSGISYKELYELSQLFDSSLPIHIASRVHAEANNASYSDEEIINTLDKRPLTPQDIELLFDEESKKRLLNLVENKQIMIKKLDNLEFYIPSVNDHRKKSKH